MIAVLVIVHDASGLVRCLTQKRTGKCWEVLDGVLVLAHCERSFPSCENAATG